MAFRNRVHAHPGLHYSHKGTQKTRQPAARAAWVSFSSPRSATFRGVAIPKWSQACNNGIGTGYFFGRLSPERTISK